MVNKIIENKNAGLNTIEIEQEIDLMIARIYELTDLEISLIDSIVLNEERIRDLSVSVNS